MGYLYPISGSESTNFYDSFVLVLTLELVASGFPLYVRLLPPFDQLPCFFLKIAPGFLVVWPAWRPGPTIFRERAPFA
jgi:hypothetical protein